MLPTPPMPPINSKLLERIPIVAPYLGSPYPAPQHQSLSTPRRRSGDILCMLPTPPMPPINSKLQPPPCRKIKLKINYIYQIKQDTNLIQDTNFIQEDTHKIQSSQDTNLKNRIEHIQDTNFKNHKFNSPQDSHVIKHQNKNSKKIGKKYWSTSHLRDV